MLLARDNILKIDEVVKQPLEKCLLYLSYFNDKTLVENQEYSSALAKQQQ